MKKRNWMIAHFVFWMALSLSAVSCGKKENNNVGNRTNENSNNSNQAAPVVESPPELVVNLSGLGSPRAAANADEFRENVRTGRFVNQKFFAGFNTATYALHNKKCIADIEEKERELFGWDWTKTNYTKVSYDCDEVEETFRKMKSNDTIVSAFGNNQISVVSDLYTIVKEGEFVRFIDSEGKAAVFNFRGVLYRIDVNFPIAVNPTYISRQTKSGNTVYVDTDDTFFEGYEKKFDLQREDEILGVEFSYE